MCHKMYEHSTQIHMLLYLFRNTLNQIGIFVSILRNSVWSTHLKIFILKGFFSPFP